MVSADAMTAATTAATTEATVATIGVTGADPAVMVTQPAHRGPRRESERAAERCGDGPKLVT
jgi:hypothetical protein